MKNLLKIYIIGMVLTLMAVVGCTNCQRPAGSGGNADDDGYNSADSLVSALGDMRDFPRLIAVTDSLENAGELPLFGIKYELCEIILCNASGKLDGVGITVMDGPFFSIMPFGKTGYHSLTSVTFTPHVTSYESLPRFDCQNKSNGYCCPEQLGNCNDCPAKPETAWGYMSNLARKYLKEEYRFEYVGSLFSMKPILQASEIDDSRPTVIRSLTEKPTLVSVLSGKINTVYDLDEVLKK